MNGAACCLALLLLCGLVTCWAFAEAAPWERVYGDLVNDFDDAPPHGAAPNERITGVNLTDTIWDNMEALGEATERGAQQMGPLVLPVTGNNDVDAGIQLRLQQQESDQNAPQGPLLRKAPLQRIAQDVLDAAVASAEPAAPTLKPLPDMLPARVWSPTFEGCPPRVVDTRCDYYKPNPRLFISDTDELMYARSLEMGQVNLIEPLTLRQTYAQFLSMDVRSKKDPYSRASATNDVAHGTCVGMAKKTPDYVVF